MRCPSTILNFPVVLTSELEPPRFLMLFPMEMTSFRDFPSESVAYIKVVLAKKRRGRMV